MHDREIAAQQQVEQQLRVAPVVLLSPPGELMDRLSVSNDQLMARFFDQSVEPQRVARPFYAHDRWSDELRIKRAYVVSFVIEHAFLLFPTRRVTPTHCLRANMQIHSDVHSHLRLLIQPMPNGSGREYQPSPQEARVS